MTKAMVFAVTQQDADIAPDVVTGITSVFDRDAHIRIDPGATHSFISMGFISNVNVEYDSWCDRVCQNQQNL